MVRSQQFTLIFAFTFVITACAPIKSTFENFLSKQDRQQLEELAATSAKAAAEAEANSHSSAEKGLTKHLLEETTDAISTWAEGMAPGTEVSIGTRENGKTESSLVTIQEIEANVESGGTVFWQGQVSNHDGGDRTTLNFGLGYRQLSEDENWLFGANGFLDHEFPYDHQRASIGLEAKSAVVDILFNEYAALSKWQDGASGNEERALDGREFELGSQIPYIPSARLFVSAFKWEGVDSASDIKGNSYSIEFNRSVGTGWVLEAGHKDFDNRPDEDFAQITFRLGLGTDIERNDTAPLISGEMFKAGSVKHRTLEKVRRTNRIVKQTGGFKVSFR